MKKILAIVAALAATTGMARADWQYTRWGMSPEEVLAASNGAASRAANPDEGADPNIKQALVGDYTTGQAAFQAKFWFKEDKLVQVNLESKPQTDCAAVSGILNSRYGKPIYEDHQDTIVIDKWRDQKTQNDVVIATYPYSRNCWVMYSKLQEPGEGGGL